MAPQLPYEELLIALENIIIDKVTTHSVSKVKKIDTSAPMEIGMAPGTDGEEAFDEGYGKTSELAVQAVDKGTGGKGWMERRKGSQLECTEILQQWQKGKEERIVLERDSGPRPEVRKEEQGKRKVAKATPEFAGAEGKQDTLRQIASKVSWNRSLNAVEEDKGDISEEVHEMKMC